MNASAPSKTVINARANVAICHCVDGELLTPGDSITTPPGGPVDPLIVKPLAYPAHDSHRSCFCLEMAFTDKLAPEAVSRPSLSPSSLFWAYEKTGVYCPFGKRMMSPSSLPSVS